MSRRVELKSNRVASCASHRSCVRVLVCAYAHPLHVLLGHVGVAGEAHDSRVQVRADGLGGVERLVVFAQVDCEELRNAHHELLAHARAEQQRHAAGERGAARAVGEEAHGWVELQRRKPAHHRLIHSRVRADDGGPVVQVRVDERRGNVRHLEVVALRLPLDVALGNIVAEVHHLKQGEQQQHR